MKRIFYVGIILFVLVANVNQEAIDKMVNVSLESINTLAMAGGEYPQFTGSKVTAGYKQTPYVHRCPATNLRYNMWKCMGGSQSDKCAVGAQPVCARCS